MASHIQIGDVSPRIQYSGNGAETQFYYPFPIFKDSDLAVYCDDVLKATGYTVSGAGESTGGYIVFATAPLASETVTLTRRLTIERISDFQESAAFRSKVLNDELDYQTAALQQLDDAHRRALHIRPHDTTSEEMYLPALAERAGKVLGFDENGMPVVSTDDLVDIEGAATHAAAAAVSAAAIPTAVDGDAGKMIKVNSTEDGYEFTFGIDDKATAERLQLSDTVMKIGEAGASTYTLARYGATGSLAITGGASFLNGGNAILYGSAHLTRPGGVYLYQNGIERFVIKATSGNADIQLKDSVGGAALVIDGDTGATKIEKDVILKGNVFSYNDASWTYYTGGTNINTGGIMLMYGTDHASQPSRVVFKQDNVIRLDIANTNNGDVTIKDNAGATALTIAGPSGNAGIGVAAINSVKLRVEASDTGSTNNVLLLRDSAAASLFQVRNDGLVDCGTSVASPYNNTTASAANMFVTSGGVIQRSTSSLRFKTQIEDMQSSYADALLSARCVWYRSTCAGDDQAYSYWGLIAEELALIDPRLVQWGQPYHEVQREVERQVARVDSNGDPVMAETSPAVAAVAAVLDEAGEVVTPAVQAQEAQYEQPIDTVMETVTVSEPDKTAAPIPDGVAYERLVVPLLNLVQRQQVQIDAMEARLTAAGL